VRNNLQTLHVKETQISVQFCYSCFYALFSVMGGLWCPSPFSLWRTQLFSQLFDKLIASQW